ncbi:ribonuclease III [Limnobacter parvus]|uniref:Ribonuclease 3 n=1 Tax=Limnobacter parvus TaxID=2939690 RepID=A0ABT1XI13_9BURK|nr:ribonuclease III [Limnobacter parvus]MCR2746917.1 ribonuclease III [Limnobacter parvus]
MEQSKYASLEAALGYQFRDQGLLRVALTHRSYCSQHNERLEFLGDSVLNCAASILLFETHPDMDEGKMSRVRSHLVKQECLALIGRNLALDQYLFLGAGELRSAKTIKESIVADALEALFGAILLDAGFEAARDCVIRLLTPVVLETPIESMGKDPKTRLQELLQGKRMKLPVYNVLVEGGTSSSPEFSVECTVEDIEITQLGQGHSRRVAEQHAAQAVLIELLEREYSDPNQASRRQ